MFTCLPAVGASEPHVLHAYSSLTLASCVEGYAVCLSFQTTRGTAGNYFFVLLRCRYADAAAHGGQVVTDTTLASSILQHWRSSSSTSKTTGSSDAAPAATAESEADAAAVPVECSWLGSFMFKGSPKPVEMVCFSPVMLRGRQFPAAPPSGKGVRVLQRVGVMEQVEVTLPAAVEGVWAC
jgi:hypothetical protein